MVTASLPPHDLAVLHDQGDLPQRRDVLGRVPFHRQQVGLLAPLDGAQLALQAQGPRAVPRRGDQRVGRAHAVLDHGAQLLGQRVEAAQAVEDVRPAAMGTPAAMASWKLSTWRFARTGIDFIMGIALYSSQRSMISS